MPIFHDHPLAPLSWFRTGGNAAEFLRADTLEELQSFMQNPKDFFILGNGSNLLFRDGGVSETVIKLGKGFRYMSRDGDHVTLGAACLNRTAVEQTLAWGLTGLEFLIGIPGSIGGAVAMNAGVYSAEIKDTLKEIRIVEPGGCVSIVTKENLHMQYRHTDLPPQSIVIDATFALRSEASETIQSRIDEFLSHRNHAQPVGGKTGGSTFKNPKERKAWELIDAVGLRGYRIGGAQFSEKHCNFIMNTDGSADDIEALGELARQRIKEQFEIDLEWEVLRVGLSLSDQIVGAQG